MISFVKWLILTPLQKLPKNVGDLGKLIVAKGFKKLPKVQKIAQSGHTAPNCQTMSRWSSKEKLICQRSRDEFERNKLGSNLVIVILLKNLRITIVFVSLQYYINH